MLPLFSIIIPVYNVAPYLRECLDSVLAQTFADWEAICVDDGSTDRTAQILDDYGSKDRRFRIIHKENAGVSIARNEAIGLAVGEYVCFLDGDDVWTPDWLEKMSGSTQCGTADIVRMQFVFWREEDGHFPVPVYNAKNDQTVVEGRRNVFKWGWLTYTKDGYIWLNAVRRKLLVEHGIKFAEGMRINEDIIFNLQVAGMSEKAVQSSFSGYLYRMRNTSAWHSRRPIEGCARYLDESIKLWEKCREQLESLDCIEQVRRNEAYMFYCAVLQWLDFGLEEERSRANEISMLLQCAHRLGMMNLKAMPLYWRPAFLWAMTLGSFSMIWLTYRLLDIYHRIHKKLIMA